MKQNISPVVAVIAIVVVVAIAVAVWYKFEGPSGGGPPSKTEGMPPEVAATFRNMPGGAGGRTAPTPGGSGQTGTPTTMPGMGGMSAPSGR